MIRVTSFAAMVCAACAASGATVNLTELEIRENAGAGNAFAFTVPDNIVATVPDGAGTTSRSSVVEWTRDVDGIGGVDDVITFTVTGTSNTANNVSWGGIGWGAAGPLDGSDSLTFTVSGVAITAGSAAGADITFDGFTGATHGAYSGNNGEFDGSADINGTAVSQVWPVAAGFQFATPGTTFPLANSVTYDNPVITTSVGFSGLQARGLSLQFTTIPEPSAALLVSLAGLVGAARRRR